MTEVIDDEWTEAVNADIPRVDLVGAPANGTSSFLLMKDDGAGLVDADLIRDLIKDADPEPVAAPVARDDITLTASPAALMKMVHEAAQRAKQQSLTIPTGHTFTITHGSDGTPTFRYPVEKAAESTATQNDLPDSDFAYIEPGGSKDDGGKTTPRALRHFPINDAAHVRNALARASQSPFGDKAMPKIKAAARKFGIDVSKETPVTAVLEKADPDMDASTVNPTDVTVGEFAESMPGSPDWENFDGDTASKWVAILGRAKAAIQWLIDREATEAVTVDPDDAEAACDLSSACDAIDYAIGVLAPFAAGEHLEAELADELTKSIALDSDALTKAVETVEGFAPLAKAGRVLSAANETAIRGAVDSLTHVLSTLPAPIPDGQPVAKELETPVTETVEKEQAPATVDTADAVEKTSNADKIAVALGTLDAPVAKAVESNAEKIKMLLGADEPVEKAKGDPLTPVYDANGELVGLVEAKNLVPIAPAAPADDSASADDAPAEAPEPTVAQPESPDAAVIPGTETVQAPIDDTVQKATAAAAAFTEALTPIAKQLESLPELANTVEVLKEQFAEMLKMPDDRKSPRLNGATGTPGIAQRDDSQVDQFAALRKAADDETDPIKKRAALNALQFEQIKARVGRPNPLI